MAIDGYRDTGYREIQAIQAGYREIQAEYPKNTLQAPGEGY